MQPNNEKSNEKIKGKTYTTSTAQTQTTPLKIADLLQN